MTRADKSYTSHIEHTRNLSVVDVHAIEFQNFTVVVDAVNGAASSALPAMVEALGCKVHRLYCDPNGTFPRGPEPLPHNLKKLGMAVIKHQADVGFATDPDGDRMAVVDEKGKPLGEEFTLTICADGFFTSTSSKTPLVTNLSTTMALDIVAEEHGSSVIRSAVGEINVVNKMKETGAQLGGEGNGGVILAESHYGRDSLVGAALFLNRMTQQNQLVSEIFQSMPQYVMKKETIKLESGDPQTFLEKIEAEFSDAMADKTDGLKLCWDNSWVHIRKSNTEPIIRIYAEGESEEKAEELVEGVRHLV